MATGVQASARAPKLSMFCLCCLTNLLHCTSSYVSCMELAGFVAVSGSAVCESGNRQADRSVKYVTRHVL